MLHSAIGLAMIGIAVGLAFRWKILLPFIVLLPVAAIIFSVSSGIGHKETVIVIVLAEIILQCGYFVGLLIRVGATTILRPGNALNDLNTRHDSEEHANDGLEH